MWRGEDVKEERSARGCGKDTPRNIPLIFLLLLALRVELKVVESIMLLDMLSSTSTSRWQFIQRQIGATIKRPLKIVLEYLETITFKLFLSANYIVLSVYTALQHSWPMSRKSRDLSFDGDV